MLKYKQFWLSRGRAQLYMQMDIHFVQEKVALGEVQVLHVHTSLPRGSPWRFSSTFSPVLSIVEPAVVVVAGVRLKTQSRPTAFTISSGTLPPIDFSYMARPLYIQPLQSVMNIALIPSNITHSTQRLALVIFVLDQTHSRYLFTKSRNKVCSLYWLTPISQKVRMLSMDNSTPNKGPPYMHCVGGAKTAACIYSVDSHATKELIIQPLSFALLWHGRSSGLLCFAEMPFSPLDSQHSQVHLCQKETHGTLKSFC